MAKKAPISRDLQAYESSRERINLDVPVPLLNRITEAIKKGAARSRNGFIIEAIEIHLKNFENALIDQEFSEMSIDALYRKTAMKVAEDFAESDWEAFQKREKK